MGHKKYKLKEIAKINPTERLEKGTLAKYVPMSNIPEFTKKVSTIEIKPYKGGMKFRNGDILFARITPCLENGKTAFTDFLDKDEVGFGSTEYIVIREKDGLSDKHYLYYLCVSPEFRTRAIKLMTGTSGRQRVQINAFKNLEISLPPLPEQKRIANILSSFDNKIELLREQNKTLENIAQTIFKQWFIDFNFPDSNGKPYKDNGGKMIDSELGLIPEAWETGRLEDLISLQSGFAHNTKLAGETKTKIAKMGVVDGKSFFNRNSVIDYSGEVDSKYKLDKEDILICTRDVTRDKVVIGNVAIIPQDLAQSGLYAGSNTWIVKTEFNKIFLFLLFKSLLFREHIISSSKGSTVVMITRDAFLNYDLSLPKKDIMKSFNEITKNIFDQIRLNTEKRTNLQKVKRLLLNKLL
jgi:type I restriction enzyme S subunit